MPNICFVAVKISRKYDGIFKITSLMKININ